MNVGVMKDYKLRDLRASHTKLMGVAASAAGTGFNSFKKKDKGKKQF
jgi:hypothetical protein